MKAGGKMNRQLKTKQDLTPHAKDRYYALAFLLPSILILGVFVIYPLLRTAYLSLFLTNARGHSSAFVGLHNYVDLFTSATYWQSVKATLVFVVAVSVFTLLLGTLLAQLATSKLRGIHFFRTAFSMTMGVSVSVAAVLWLFIFNPSVGLLDRLFVAIGLPNIQWLTKPEWAIVAIIITTVWMNLGFTFLIVFGAMQGVPTDLYQVAAIEGVSEWQRFTKITLPMISPTLFFVVIITLIQSFKTFGIVDMMTTGGPNNATNFLVYRLYQDAFINGNYGLASAEAVILAIIISIFTWLEFKFGQRRIDYKWGKRNQPLLSNISP